MKDPSKLNEKISKKEFYTTPPPGHLHIMVRHTEGGTVVARFQRICPDMAKGFEILLAVDDD